MKKYDNIIIIFCILIILIYFSIQVKPNSIITKKNAKKDPIGTFQLLTTIDRTDETNPLVVLDWSNYGDSSNSIFKGYQSKDGGETWESISLMDYTSVTRVNVLNVYPEKGDGLKDWMETSTDTTTGEVLGKGIIKVDKINISEFNTNPEEYLKKTDSEWNYDVIVFGFWDRNNYYDLSDASKTLIDTFIQDGKGVVFGHDTGSCNSLARTDTVVFNTDTAEEAKNGQDNFTFLTNKYLGMHWENGLSVGSTEIEITKKGLLTYYPWDLGPIGTKYVIPNTHSWGQVLEDNSNIWMKFSANESVPGSNFYLVTNNNTAMIQTGHTSGTSTEPEQKILANLIFYCYQLTSAVSITDYSSMDVAPPVIDSTQISGDYNGINVSLSATEKGSSYSYYIEGYTKPDMSIITSRSNTATATVESGFKGYYYVIDDQPTNNFNKNNAEYTTSNINLGIQNNGKYIHIKAVDKAENMSAVKNIKIELEKMILTLKPNGGKIDNIESDKEISMFYNEPIELPIPTRKKYIFDKWEKEGETQSILQGNSFTMKERSTLKATWKEDFNENGIDDALEDRFTIIYQDGLGDTIFSKQIYNNQLIDIDTPSFTGNSHRSKYVLAGWSPTVEAKVTKNVTYTAVWKEDINENNIADEDEEKYTITYQDGVGETAFSKQVYTNQLVDMLTPNFSGIPQRDKYIFSRWNPEVSTKIIGNATYTAVWKEDFNENGIADEEEEKYTVTYQDGENQTIFNNKVFTNLLVGLDTPQYTEEISREKYIFMGWSPTIKEKVEGNQIYTATWTEDFNVDGIPDEEQPRYTVTYIDGCNQTVFNDFVVDNLLPNMQTPIYDGTPVRKDYVFVGWSPMVEEKVNENTIYQALWKKDINNNGIDDEKDNVYKVTFKDGNNNTIFDETTYEILEGMKAPVMSNDLLKRDGYEFAGWSENPDITITKDMVFVAQWNKVVTGVPNTKISINKIQVIISILMISTGIIILLLTNKKNYEQKKQ